jgi:phage repressor protein C with HTH and peptisase S24 domain
MQERITVTMNVHTILGKIQEITRENHTQLARRFKVSQPTVTRWFGGSEPEGPNRDRIVNQGRKLGVIGETDFIDNSSIPIVGFVGAGGRIIYEEGQGPFGEANMPPKGASGQTVAVVVRGDSMAGQLEDGWTVYYNDRQFPPTEKLMGKLCVVGLTDGQVLVKTLYMGRKDGLYDLLSKNAAPLHDQPVKWAAKVIWIEPS